MPISHFTFEVSGLDPKLLQVSSFQGVEELGSLYRYDLVLVSEEPAVVFDDVVGKPALLSLKAADQDEPRLIHGIVSDFEQGAEGKRQNIYYATLVPEAVKLDARHDCRIFQELDVPTIIKKVVDGAGLASCTLKSSLTGSYRTWDYCVQYRESDWDFMLRLMEEEGIYCHFEHDKSEHTLVLSDSPSAHPPIPGESTVAFKTPVGALVTGEHVAKFRYAERVRPGKVTLRDYDFQKPKLDLTKTDSAEKNSDIEVYDYPGEYVAPGDGQSLAKKKLEHWQAQRKTARGESGCTRFLAGRTFTMAEHPRPDFNRGWMMTRIEHEGTQPHLGEHSDTPMSYHTRFVCIPDDVQFRLAERTPKPKIYGVQTAIVVGPAGEEIYPDEHGRVKVQFHWDRLGKNDERSSCWIRVSQLWAGAGWGGMHIPRIGHEVVVDFLEGDPDRPLIVGRVYHGTNVPPYKLPAEKTISTIKSESSIGGGGYNELRFEDKKGNEEIWLHGQKDWRIRIENDKNQDIGHDETLVVGNDRKKEVKHDQSETVGNNKSISVGGSHSENIALTESVTVGLASSHTVGGAFAENIGAAKATTVGGILTEVIGASMSVTIGTNKDQSVGGSLKEGIGKDLDQKVGNNYKLTVTKEMRVDVKENANEGVGKVKSVTVGDKYSLVVGDAKLTMQKNGDIVLEGKEIRIKGSGPIYVEGSKLEIKSEGTVDLKASGAIKIKGSAVDVN